VKILSFLVLLASGACLGQQTTPSEPQNPQLPSAQQQQQQPAEAAAGEPAQQPVQREEPEVIQPLQPAEVPAEATEAATEYRGPAILSRGGEPSVRQGSELFTIRPFAAVDTIYDTGLVTPGLNHDGRFGYDSGFGVEAAFGVTGARSWRRSSLAVDYRGAARHYTEQTYYDGSDHTLLLRYENQVSRRWLIALTEGASSFSRTSGLPFAAVQGYDPTFGMLTGNELFDGRTNALYSAAQAVYQQTARLSFGLGANGFVVRRRSDALTGATGWAGTGDVAYRLGRYSSAGVDYSFSRFEYQNRFGESTLHGLAANYARRLNRSWELSLRAGALRVETSRLQVVTLDPAIAAILGRSTAVSIFYGVTYLPQYGARLARYFRRSIFSVGYDRTVTPGNGVFLTSTTDVFDASYSDTLSSRLSFSLGAGASRLKALSQALGNYTSYGVRAGVSYRLAASLSVLARINGTMRSMESSQIDRNAYRIAFGIGWTPGDYPVSVW